MGVLSGVVIAIAGALPAEPAQIKKWVDNNGGKWSPRVEQRVTHLIASRPAWKAVTDPVMKAAELNIHIVSFDWLEDSLQGKRKLPEKRYTYEAMKKQAKTSKELKKYGAAADSKKFVEGCEKIKELTGSGTSKKLRTPRKPKPSKSHFFAETINSKFVSAKDALMQRRAEREAKEAAEKAEKGAKKASSSGTAQAPITIDDGTPEPVVTSSLPTPPPSASSTKTASKHSTSPSPSNPPAITSLETQAKNPTLKDLYHFYLDSTGFEYKVTLARSNFSVNQITRYQLSILESHTRPHTYCTLVQYNPPPTPEAFDASIRNPLLAFLRPTPTPSTLPSPAEQARLHSLVTLPAPTPAAPFKKLICPMNSPFTPAWRAFRHTFRTLTLLAWEERFDIDASKALQTARAVTLGIEPYIYSKPMLGLPVGMCVQEAGLFQGNRSDLGSLAIEGDKADGYVRNEFDLPGTDDQPLSMNGVVGSAIWRAEQKVKKAEREREEREEQLAKEEKEKAKAAKRKFVDRPLFNGVMGKPRAEEEAGWRPKVVQKEGAAVFTVFKKGRAFPWGRER
ncbi:hypothetical protein HBI70_107810 [Parastagonospora nodorum]|nr:hypothetical protein HBH49_144560 [Parastagonospora nodorum]KAH4263771.1 hypothetical protein HBI03_097690 [Parastagonospora nodorum]KAH4271054.1 hypothetical protein HBI04_150880 [Parastagonospora nodorum]KAH4811693.1 hypothetical protein HBH61_089250 [Parastagonospora nodorum]KAH4929423.1 hypothetical protein HBI79_120280 [Parastagonospora nodorum]